MSGSLDTLMAATALFVGSHFMLSSAPLRRPLVRSLGERGFAVMFSLVAIAAFAWMIRAYGAAPYIETWTPAPAFIWVPVVAMPFALVLAVTGLSGPSPTLLPGGEGLWEGRDPTAGIIRVTRHPFLVGVVLWAGAHLLTNGDAASIILFGGFLVLAVGGIRHIDRKKEARLGAEWGPILLTTSVVPFAAILSGRTAMDWRGLGWWRVALALALYVVLGYLHPPVFGVAAWPG
jgi:uncharacterized membrane protein